MKYDNVVKVVIGTPGSEGVEYTDLKINFRVQKTDSSDPNTCEVRVYNLNEYSRTNIDTEDHVLQLYAGYTNDVGEKMLFQGDINEVSIQVIEPNIITKISCADGQRKINDSKISISMKENTSVYQLVSKAVDSLGLPVKTKSLLEPLKNVNIKNGTSFVGSTKKLLDTVFAGVGMDWSIQNEEVTFYGKNDYDNSNVVELSYNSGLLGNPEKIKIKKGTHDGSKDVSGWRVRSLIDPLIEPGGAISIDSEYVSGSYFKVINVIHSGDSVDGGTITISEVIEL